MEVLMVLGVLFGIAKYIASGESSETEKREQQAAKMLDAPSAQSSDWLAALNELLGTPDAAAQHNGSMPTGQTEAMAAEEQARARRETAERVELIARHLRDGSPLSSEVKKDKEKLLRRLSVLLSADEIAPKS